MLIDDDTCYRALRARDSRFDGRFFVGVLSTGIYCRPVCPARTPLRRNVRFFGSAAAAVAAGLRACRRCRPDSLPGSREWDHRSDLVARALRLLGSGAADEGGVEAVARALNVTQRHLNRALTAEVGTTAGQLARTRRAQTARLLLEHTTLTLTDVAFAAGFGSVRQFNDVMRAQFGVTPGELRRAVRPARDQATPISDLTVRLPFRTPYAVAQVVGWLQRHAVPGVDDIDAADPAHAIVRTTKLDDTRISVRFGARTVVLALGLPAGASLREIPRHIASVRRWLDLEAAPGVIDSHLLRDPTVRPWVEHHPGLRVLGALDPFRALTSTIVSQQVSVAAAATHSARLIDTVGPGGRFPTPAELAEVDPERLAAALGVPRARGRTLVAAAEVIATERVHLGPTADREHVMAVLGSIPGIGPWTLADVRMRALGDPDVWPDGDLVLRRALGPGGLFAGVRPIDMSPWRSYLAHHVWVAAKSAQPESADPGGAARHPRGAGPSHPTGRAGNADDRWIGTQGRRAQGEPVQGEPVQGEPAQVGLTRNARKEST